MHRISSTGGTVSTLLTHRLSERYRQRLLRARKTTRESELELMMTLRPDRPTVVAEGDSWFAYPAPNLFLGDDRSNVINWLARAANLNLLQLSSNGDEAVQMLSGPAKHRLIKVLQRFSVDFLLFSGGGNDLVGAHDLQFLLRDGQDTESDEALDYLQPERLGRRLDAIEIAYLDLIDYCRTFSRNPGIRIITHCYDYALPSSDGASFLGGLLRPDGGRSWMQPTLLQRRIPERHHASIARHLIDELAERLLHLQALHPEHFQVVETRGLLTPQQWVNEIHPDRAGFAIISAAILDAMREHDTRLA